MNHKLQTCCLDVLQHHFHLAFMLLLCCTIDQNVVSPTLQAIFFWKIYGALVMPNGSLLGICLPNGMIKVVSSQRSGCDGIWKKPLAASSDEKTVAPRSFAVISSVNGRM